MTSKEKYTDEETLLCIWDSVKNLIKEYSITHIAIEDLSYDSISSSKDIIAGNFWFVRTNIHRYFPDFTFTLKTPTVGPENAQELGKKE